MNRNNMREIFFTNPLDSACLRSRPRLAMNKTQVFDIRLKFVEITKGKQRNECKFVTNAVEFMTAIISIKKYLCLSRPHPSRFFKGCLHKTKYSRMDKVKFVEGSL